MIVELWPVVLPAEGEEEREGRRGERVVDGLGRMDGLTMGRG